MNPERSVDDIMASWEAAVAEMDARRERLLSQLPEGGPKLGRRIDETAMAAHGALGPLVIQGLIRTNG